MGNTTSEYLIFHREKGILQRLRKPATIPIVYDSLPMDLSVSTYLLKLMREWESGHAREHSYRPALKDLIEAIDPTVLAINEPKRQEVGAPDFIISRKDVPIAFIEAKDIDVDLGSIEKSEQIKRYQGLGNLLVTNYLEFSFFEFEKKVASISLGRVVNGKIFFASENFKECELLLKNFLSKTVRTITQAKSLAKIMADKAKLMREIIVKSLISGHGESAALHEQFLAFQKILIDDLTQEAFADIYAQTITYGLFAARYHDTTLENFTRQEAEYLIPKSNPFLRKFFHHIAGPDLDDRIVWIVDALADVFNHCDLTAILKNFGKTTGRLDPVLHFYETFLSEYDPKLRKARGVYYTPEPVVNYIVRSVDHILKTYFGLAEGLKDTSKIEIHYEGQGKTEKERKQKKIVHKVQVLDPATGTGTFLNEVIKYIHQSFVGQEGIWNTYVHQHLLPRIHGFELMMASYTIAHLKLGMFLNESGYKGDDERLGIYLTNSLNDAHEDTNTLFATWLSKEANEANDIKKNVPIMVVLGNPPYSVSSHNNGEWISKKVSDYKEGLNEKNIQPLSDDYIKFLRYAQYCVEKNGSGIVAMITNNSFLDGVIHRKMRKSLLETFDTIYIYDLHGNAKKKETAPDGSKDENVFDIMQGVSINIFVKTTDSKKDATVYHVDSYGTRELKYERLWNETLRTAGYKKLEPKAPYHFFVPKDFAGKDKYEMGVSISLLFKNFITGVQTKRDGLFIDFEKQVLSERIKILLTKNYGNEFVKNFKIEDSSGYKLLKRINICKFDEKFLTKILYRPFDIRDIYYDQNLIGRAFDKVMKHFIKGQNYGLITLRLNGSNEEFVAMITKTIVEKGSLPRGNYCVFPLYLYPETDATSQSSLQEQPLSRTPNLNLEIVNQIAQKLDLTFTPERSQDADTFCPEDLLDYIYAVLHSPTYRETYKEFLKIDFPRVPFTNKKELFFQLKEKGKALRELHLLTSPVLDKLITGYPINGSNTVEKVSYEIQGEKGRVFINKEQYFEDVPKVAWNFYVGGYQPAQKWLKDRKGRTLDFEDIMHYQKIIVALAKTSHLMKEIDSMGKSEIG